MHWGHLFTIVMHFLMKICLEMTSPASFPLWERFNLCLDIYPYQRWPICAYLQGMASQISTVSLPFILLGLSTSVIAMALLILDFQTYFETECFSLKGLIYLTLTIVTSHFGIFFGNFGLGYWEQSHGSSVGRPSGIPFGFSCILVLPPLSPFPRQRLLFHYHYTGAALLVMLPRVCITSSDY